MLRLTSERPLHGGLSSLDQAKLVPGRRNAKFDALWQAAKIVRQPLGVLTIAAFNRLPISKFLTTVGVVGAARFEARIAMAAVNLILGGVRAAMPRAVR